MGNHLQLKFQVIGMIRKRIRRKKRSVADHTLDNINLLINSELKIIDGQVKS